MDNRQQTNMKEIYLELLNELGQENNPDGNIDLGSDTGKPKAPIKEIAFRILDKAGYIAIAAVLGGIIAWAITFFLIAPKYTATSKILIFDKNSAVTTASLQIGSSLAADYAQVFKNHEVHEQVINNLGLSYSTGYMESRLSISNPSSTRILMISFVDESPERACQIANEYSVVARDFIQNRISPNDDKEASEGAVQYVNEFESAVVPKSPSSPNMTRNIILGALIGFVLSTAVFAISFALDDKIRSAEDIEYYVGLPSLGLMPLSVSKEKTPNKLMQTAKNIRLPKRPVTGKQPTREVTDMDLESLTAPDETNE